MWARQRKLFTGQDRFLTNGFVYQLGRTFFIGRKYWIDFFFGITDKHKSRTNHYRLKPKNQVWRHKCNSIHNYLLEHTSMKNGLNVKDLKTSNFQCLQRKTEWFSGWYSLTTGNHTTLCLKIAQIQGLCTHAHLLNRFHTWQITFGSPKLSKGSMHK